MMLTSLYIVKEATKLVTQMLEGTLAAEIVVYSAKYKHNKRERNSEDSIK